MKCDGMTCFKDFRNCFFLYRGATEEENVKAVLKDGQVHGVIDFVGVSPSLSTAFKCLSRSGTLVTVGLAGGKIAQDCNMVTLFQKNVSTSN